jgi:two-component system cell cycle sensor histidine kinase/response regulator CckA
MATSPAAAIDAPLSSLTTGAAHDLRNLLFVISAHCESLMDAIAPQDSRRADLDAIRDAVDRGATLASQLVTTARVDARSMPADVQRAILGIEPLVQRLVGDGVSVSLCLSASSWPVTANTVQIEQIVMNLAVNARDAMPQGGRLTIATENRTLSGAGAGQPAEFVVISVTDSGHGIDPSIQDRIFEPFFTTKGSGGSGVGLATVRAIAVLNGGHVETVTTEGAGTTMRVVLPRALEPAGHLGNASAGPAVGQARRSVLLVQNEPAIRDYLRRCLAAEGYDVQVAATGAEALVRSESPLPAVDIVIADVYLPDLGGMAVASRLRGVWPDVGLVLISGEADGVADLSTRTGIPVLAKPFTTAELMAAVRAALPLNQPL